MISAQTTVQSSRLAAFKPTHNALRRAGVRVRAAPKAKMVRVNAAMAPTMAPAAEPQWGPKATHAAEWRKNLDLEAWGAEMRALERELKEQQGEKDVKHLQKVLFWSNVCYFSGLALCGVCNPMAGNPIAALLLSTGIFARWTMVGHHVSHGGYNRQQVGKRFHRSTFGKGFIARAVDWLDWMLPEAWDVEHNNLHHYKLGELGDPDLIERNLTSLRENEKMPQILKYAQAVGLMAIWKWFYYMPNTLKEMYDSQMKRGQTNAKYANVTQPYDSGAEPTTMALILGKLFTGNPAPFMAILPVMLPYMVYHFVLVPLPFYLLGGPAMGAIALANMVATEIATNVHAFIAIATNHCGNDVYRFETEVLPKTDEFYLRAVIGSVNFRTAHTTPDMKKEGAPAGPLGNANDFMHGWLNYQIEHHMFPDMSMLSYQKAMPRVKEACERHGIPYVQESVWLRLKKTCDVMTGNASMKQWERGD